MTADELHDGTGREKRLVPGPSPRAYRRQLEHEDREKIARIVGETDSTGSAGVLRGIPAIGRGCGGAIRGTNPVSALLARESRRP